MKRPAGDMRGCRAMRAVADDGGGARFTLRPIVATRSQRHSPGLAADRAVGIETGYRSLGELAALVDQRSATVGEAMIVG